MDGSAQSRKAAVGAFLARARAVIHANLFKSHKESSKVDGTAHTEPPIKGGVPFIPFVPPWYTSEQTQQMFRLFRILWQPYVGLPDDGLLCGHQGFMGSLKRCSPGTIVFGATDSLSIGIFTPLSYF